MWDFLRANPFVVGALSGSLAAYLLGLLVSHLRRDKRWLGYSVNSRNIVQRGHSKLAIQYDGKSIARLDSHAIVLRNIGNKPLVQLPVRIEALGDGAVVESEVHGPEGAKCPSVVDGTAAIVVTSDLLNPGEVVTIGLTVADASRSEVKVVARGELLQVKEIGVRADTAELLEALLPHAPLGALLFDVYRFLKGPRRH
jgi:hypothetical protein